MEKADDKLKETNIKNLININDLDFKKVLQIKSLKMFLFIVSDIKFSYTVKLLFVK